MTTRNAGAAALILAIGIAGLLYVDATLAQPASQMLGSGGQMMGPGQEMHMETMQRWAGNAQGVIRQTPRR